MRLAFVISILVMAGCSHSGDTRKAFLIDNPPPHKYYAGESIAFKERNGVEILSLSESYSPTHGPIYHVQDREYGVYQDVYEDFLDKLAAAGTVIKNESLANYWDRINKEKLK